MKFDIKQYSKQHKLKHLPSRAQILIHSKGKIKLRTKPTRTISGVAPVAIMTRYFPCPHGRCIMCPTEKNIPQSYTGREPASRRAVRNKFNPYLQVMNRLEQYTLLGHTPEKVELIIMGGNFTSFPLNYQNKFITGAFQAMNDFSKLGFEKFLNIFALNEKRDSPERLKKVEKNILSLQEKTTLIKEQEKNEHAKIRCIAMAIESRPDYCQKKQISTMLSQGTTRVELGVQTIYNKILSKIQRGHTIEDSIKATQLLKDSFLKVGYHWMPGLPNSSLKTDLAAFKEIFANPDFRPDALKIYPCMVLKNTELYNLWKNRQFTPLTTSRAKELIIKFKKYIPEYCRIMRIQRDIPTYMTESGVNITNLRQLIHEEMQKRDIKCRCIRCREPRNQPVNLENAKLVRRDYAASGGHEIFLSYETKSSSKLSSKDFSSPSPDRKEKNPAQDILLGFLRLRIPYKPFRKEITKNSAGIRELHVYGQLAPLTKSKTSKPKLKSQSNQRKTIGGLSVNKDYQLTIQHKGIGKLLLSNAEAIAKDEFDCKKLLVLSGIGARQYYKKLNYKQDGVYVSKGLK